jgi:superfamily II DNA or RNA helicase
VKIYNNMQQLDRNSTSFPLELSRELARATWSPTFDFLYYHQNIARIYFAREKTRGLLIYHETGMGKSLLAASIAMDAIFPRRDSTTVTRERNVIILLSKSLATNMSNAVKQYIDERSAAGGSEDMNESSAFIALARMDEHGRDAWIARNFDFVTMNASNMITQMARATYAASDEDEDIIIDVKARQIMQSVPDLDGKLLIVDEAHNLFRAITNGSANAATLYESIMNARDLKLAFLTGTPIANDPFETAICFNMLAGARIFPEFYVDFERLFIGKREECATDAVAPNGSECAREMFMIRRDRFQNRIFGLVSYVNYKSTLGVGVADILGLHEGTREERPKQQVEFPEEFPEEVVRVPMTSDQFAAYIGAREVERAEGAKAAMRGGSHSSTDDYRATREVLGARPMKVMFARKMKSARETHALHKPRSEFSSLYRVHSRQIGNYCAPPELRSKMIARGDEEIMPVGALLDGVAHIVSPKYEALLARVREHPETLGMVYSQFVGIGGLASLARFLDQNGFAGRYATISGMIPIEDRADIIARFCAHENLHGEHIALLLVSSTGAEGIDLKGVRHVHILEPYWNYGRIRQVKARAIRNRSHIDLPLEERNVTTYIYVAVAPAQYELDELVNMRPEIREIVREKTSDEELYDNSRKNQRIVEQFERAIREVSIECAINHDREGRARECRMCAPTGDRMFTDDIESDMRVTNPCKPVASEIVENVQKIQVGAETFAWRHAHDGTIEMNMYGFEVFVYDARINAWRKMRINDARYDAIVAHIKSAQETTHS